MAEVLNNLYDVVIVGGGPAGLTAGIYLARACYRVLIIEKEKFGGQITITSEVVNYPGVEKTSGSELTNHMRKQAENFGAEFLLAEVKDIDNSGDIKKVITSKGTFDCFGIIIATGAHPRMIGFKGESEFKGHGVAYCATCDGEFFTGKEVFVIGGGFAAAEESVFLTKYAKHVTVLVREDDFTCAKATAEETKNHEKITVLYNTEVEEVSGDSVLREIRYRNNKTNEVTTYTAQDNDTFGVFVFAGYEPSTDFVSKYVELDPHGYVITDKQQKTNVDGIYAAGDVCIKNLRQVVTAVGEAALAATELEKYCTAVSKKLNVMPDRDLKKADNDNKEDTDNSESSNELFNSEIINQLNTVFSKMENPLILKLYLDDRPVSMELKEYMNEMAERTDKISVQIDSGDEIEKPCVRVCDKDGNRLGLSFHGVPGGHEFTSFVLGLYNASGPGQKIADETKERINRINKNIEMKILVSLTCTMCPELVTAAQRIASLNDKVNVDVYDINHFGELKDKYNVMSVPCFVINEDKVMFGKKNIDELLDIIEEL
jgi:thioredoxin reductase (NADPH)